ncbi:MAG: UDP-N-acetylmuramoyl-L-alanine--D-glutamate ligase [Rickettsiales bacterium]|nr:UDP-N-acetylmuramoyl-L-alanine--D-glutamate ligase [Rickettsiales bacterium]
MITLPFLKGQHVGVVGLGKSGLATVDSLLASDAKVCVWDDGDAAAATVKQRYGDKVDWLPVDEWHWGDIALVVLAPGVPYTHPAPHAAVEFAAQHNVEIVGDVELLYRAQPDATYVAITGTNGKSTTTSLIAHILGEAGRTVQVGGNLGIAALGLEPLNEQGIYVLELSSYQLDLIRTTRFDAALLLNISPDHLDRHGDIDGYITAKRHIFERQEIHDAAIVGVDDAYSEAVCRDLIAKEDRRVIPIMTTQTSSKGIWVKDAVLHNPLSDDAIAYDLSSIATLNGEHNHQNAAAAYAACWHVGLSHDEIARGMESFAGLAHRMQLVTEHEGVLFVNDSKATNADAAARSLGSYQNIHWIVGGVAKAGGIEPLSSYFPRVKHAYLIGEASGEFAKTLDGKAEYSLSGEMAQAVKQTVANAAPGDVILLAPACASFDQYPNFEARGDAFIALVHEMTQAEETADAV